MDQFKGYIPFSRRLAGETVITPIDVISELFQMNIQIFLPDGTCVTQLRNGPFIPILHNGIDHFDGLEPGARAPMKPLGITDVMAQMSLKDRPVRFQMDHLLQAGHLGTRYQFLVLLQTVLKLLLKRCNFTAKLEAKGHGNLDDIVIHSTGQDGRFEIQAFQVKYYVDAIKADLFFNKTTKSNTKKNAKMHIGKFFEGWSSLNGQNPKSLKSIVYSNTSLDAILIACTGGKETFSEAFVTNQQRVNCFLGDFYDVLFEQAQEYLGKEIDPLDFQIFLRSFRFCIQQKDLEPLTESIVTNLSQVTAKRRDEIQIDQLFLNLYSLVEDLFCHDRTRRTPPVLTPKLLEQFIERAQVHFHDKVVLLGRTQEALEQIQEGAAQRVVSRSEWNAVYRLMNQEGVVVVVGGKGIGKSSLIKSVLKQYKPAEYLFFSTRELVENDAFKSQVSQVLAQENEVRIVVLDSAEILLDFSPEKAKAFIRAFLKKNRAVVVTLTPPALNRVAVEQQTEIEVKPLDPREVLRTFPELEPYAEIKSLLDLACVPFYLNIILKLIAKLKKPQLDEILARDNTPLEAELIRQVVEGQEKQVVQVRRGGWLALAAHRAKEEKTAALGPKMRHLKEDDIVAQKNGEWDFTHDLFFEYGLIEIWTVNKSYHTAQGNELTFWEELPTFLEFSNSILVLAKWFSMGGKDLRLELLGHVGALSNKPVFKCIIEMAIVLQDVGLLTALLPHQGNAITANLDDYVMLSIAIDAPKALETILRSSYEPSKKVVEKQLKLSSSSETDSTHSSEEDNLWENYSSRSESEESDRQSIQSLGPSDLEVFCRSVEKYWQAGFDEDPGMFDDEGEWIDNSQFESPPDNTGLYLHQAVLLDRVACVEVLVGHQKGSIRCNNYQETPLHLAVLRRNKQVVAVLIRMKGIVNDYDTWGETPLHNVAYVGDLEIAQQLLEEGADPNRQNECGITPLHIAATRLDLEMVKLFLEHGGDLSINPFESEGVTVAELLDHLDPSLQEKMEEFVLALIAHLGYGHEERTEEIVEDLMTLVEHRAQISEHFPGFDYYDSETELEYAVEHGDVEKIEELEETILSDPENIDQVLDSDGLRDLKEELVNGWMESCSDEQFKNLKIYAAVYDDEEVQK